MDQAANQRALRTAVWRLAQNDVDADDVSRAIDAFGQVLADLTDTPLRLAVISGEAFEENNELRAKIARLESEIRLTRLNGVKTLQMNHPAFDEQLNFCTGSEPVVIDGVTFVPTDMGQIK